MGLYKIFRINFFLSTFCFRFQRYSLILFEHKKLIKDLYYFVKIIKILEGICEFLLKVHRNNFLKLANKLLNHINHRNRLTRNWYILKCILFSWKSCILKKNTLVVYIKHQLQIEQSIDVKLQSKPKVVYHCLKCLIFPT